MVVTSSSENAFADQRQTEAEAVEYAIFQVKALRDRNDEIFARYEFVTNYYPEKALVNVHLSDRFYMAIQDESDGMFQIFSEEQRRQLKIWESDLKGLDSAARRTYIQDKIKAVVENRDNSSKHGDVDVVLVGDQETYLNANSDDGFDADFLKNQTKLMDSSNVVYRDDDWLQKFDKYFNKVLPVPFFQFMQHLDRWQLFAEFRYWKWLDMGTELQRIKEIYRKFKAGDDSKLADNDSAGECLCMSCCCFSCPSKHDWKYIDSSAVGGNKGFWLYFSNPISIVDHWNAVRGAFYNVNENLSETQVITENRQSIKANASVKLDTHMIQREFVAEGSLFIGDTLAPAGKNDPHILDITKFVNPCVLQRK